MISEKNMLQTDFEEKNSSKEIVVFVDGWQNDTLDFKSKTQHTLITRHASQDGHQSPATNPQCFADYNIS